MLSAELPGMTEKHVQIEIAGGVLTIRSEKKAERSDEGRYFTERTYGAFERRIPLEDVEEDKAEASFKNGLLTVLLPKSDMRTRAWASSASRSTPSSTSGRLLRASRHQLEPVPRKERKGGNP
jgi:hypothetical protein